MVDVPVPIVVVVAWVVVGLLTAVWMARHGHRDPAWFSTAAILGPIMAVAAAERVQRRPAVLARMDSGDSGGRRAGRLRVLVGVDGSAASQAALDLAIDVLGPCAETLVVAEVVDYDAAESDWRGRVVAAKRRLITAAEQGGGRPMTCEVLAGPPAQTLAQFARENDIDVVVVGRHGHGLSGRLVGDVTRELVRDAPVPVLVAGGGPHASRVERRRRE